MPITMNKSMYILLIFCFLSVSCNDDETSGALQPAQMVKVVIPFQFLSSETAADDNGETFRSVTDIPVSKNDFKLIATDCGTTVPATRAMTPLNNTWILAFASEGLCLSCTNIGDVSPDAPIVTSLPIDNQMTLYILANGPASLSKPGTLAEFESAEYFSTAIYTNENEVPYVGKKTGVNVDADGRLFNDDGTDVQVPLSRIAAKLSITCTVSVKDYVIESARLFNAPAKMYYVYSNTTAEINADALDPSNISGNTYTWFTGDNLRGTGSSANQFERYAENAPASSTFIRITLRSTIGAETVAYDIYPGKNLADNYDLARNWDYTYATTFNRSASELTSDRRVAVTDVPIDLTTLPSNCFVLAPGNSYKFDPRIKGEGQEVTGGTDIPVRHDVDEIRLIWQDTKSLVRSIGLSSDRDIVVVKLTPSLEGNAVVAAYKGGNPVWNWHLWVRSKEINRYTTNRVSGMSCVLGSLNKDNADFDGPAVMGLLYQWGRHTPFPRATSFNAGTPEPVYDIDNNPVSFDISKGAQSISSVIEHPTTFYYTGVAGATWHTDGEDLWGGVSGEKTIFDPCPRGWKIPQNHTIWSDWSKDPSSREYFSWEAEKYARQARANTVLRSYYPAVGFYTNMPEGTQPALTNVGYEGRYWTGIFSGGTAGVLRFTANVSGSTRPDNNIVEQINVDQTYGCSVRPVVF